MRFLAAEVSYKHTREFRSDDVSECLNEIAKWISGGGIVKDIALFENLGEAGWTKRKLNIKMEIG